MKNSKLYSIKMSRIQTLYVFLYWRFFFSVVQNSMLNLHHMFTIISSLILFLSLLLGCQQGEKKTPDSVKVYTEQENEIQNLEVQMVQKKLVVHGKTIKAEDIHLPEDLGFEQEGLLLASYITKIQKLLALADEKVVLFPRKAELQNKMYQASNYLGQWLTRFKTDQTPELLTSADVDYTEYKNRFKRVSICSKVLIEFGFDFERPDLFPTLLKTVKSDVLRLSKDAESFSICMDDTFRINLLSKRNTQWGHSDLKNIEDFMSSFGKLFYIAKDAVEKEVVRRNQLKELKVAKEEK